MLGALIRALFDTCNTKLKPYSHALTQGVKNIVF